MDIKNIVEKAFLREWEVLKGWRLTDDNIALIGKSFEFPAIEHMIYEEALHLPPQERGRAVRRHEVALRGLARQYAQYLYQTSKRGGRLDVDAIREAKKILRSGPKCPVYPCG